jgi:hypothetical protein
MTTDPWDVIGDLPVEPSGEPADDATTSFGAVARADALIAGYPDWMNVTRWPIDCADEHGDACNGECHD